MRTHVTVGGVKYRIVKALISFEQSKDDMDANVCGGCVFKSQQECHERFRASGRLKCVDGNDDAHRDTDRTDYILIHNTPEALAAYVAQRLI